MSASPKYTSVRLSERRRRQLEHERRRQAAAEQERRRAEEQRRRQERLGVARGTAETMARDVHKQIDTLTESDLGSFMKDDLAAARKEISNARQQLVGAKDESRVREILSSLRRMDDYLRIARHKAQGVQLAHRLAREEAALESLRSQLAGVDGARSAKFDPGILDRVRESISAATEAFRHKSLDQVRALLSKAQARLDAHLHQVAQEFALWSAQKEKAIAKAAGVQDMLGGLEVDSTVQRWEGAKWSALKARAQGIDRLIASERFAVAEAECDRVATESEQLLAAAQERQLKEDQKQHVIHAATAALQEMGFFVLAGYPAPQTPQDPDSATIIQARHPDGGALAMMIPQEGEIVWDVAGSMHATQLGDGQMVRSCPQIEEQIVHISDLLRDQGVELGEPWWQEKCPDDIRSGAEVLPAYPTPVARENRLDPQR